jgi:hypothetical protein
MAVYRDIVLSDNPIGYWRLGETSGTTAASEVGGHHGTYNGTITKGRPGVIVGDSNTSILNGSGGYIQIPWNAAFQTNNWSLEAWIYPTSLPPEQSGIITEHFTGLGNPIKFVLMFGAANLFGANKLAIGRYTGAAWQGVGETTNISLNQWHHIVGTYDGANFRLYRNGVQVAIAAATGTVAGADPIVIGRGISTGYPTFPGNIDEVAIYGAALPADRILKHYEAAFNLPPVADFSISDSGMTQIYTDTSTDPQGISNIVTRSWNFGSGATPATATGVGPHTVVYATEGQRSVSLTVTDAGGLTSTKTVNTTIIKPPPPVISLNIYASVDGSNYTLVKKLENLEDSNWTTDIPATGLLAPRSPTITVDNLIEKTITLNWNNPGNEGSRRWFKISNMVEGVESPLTPSRDIVATPLVNRYVLERKLEGQTDTFFTKIYDGSAIQFTDTNVAFGQTYVYRITAYNSVGQPSTPSVKSTTATPPYPPLFTNIAVFDNPNGSQFVRMAGRELNSATSVELQRSIDSANWVTLKNAKIGIPPGGVGTEEWWEEDNSPPITAPSVAVWDLATQPVDTDGVHLTWLPAPNVPAILHYRAIRKFNNVNSTPSATKSTSIQPIIKRYDIQRRETPVPGANLTPANNWVTIGTNLTTPQNPIPATKFDDTDVSFSKVYDYRIIATNNFGQASSPSVVKTLSTFEAPPPPPPPPPPLGGVVSNARPSGVVDITSEGFLRIVWDFTHPTGDTQAAYILKAEYPDENDVVQTRWWNGSSWSTNNTTVVSSPNTFADVSPSIFISGERVDMYLEVISTNGGRSNVYGQ